MLLVQIKKYMLLIGIAMMSLTAQNSLFSQTEEHWVENLLLEDPLLFFQKENGTISVMEYQQAKQFQQANIYIENKNFLKALELYVSAYQKNKENSTALLGVANVYFLLGDVINAKNYYTILYDTLPTLHYDARNIVRYRLALLYFFEENEEAFVAILQEIVQEKEALFTNDLDVLKKILVEDGLDDIHVFVKVDFDSSFYAFRELGIYYISAGQQDKGIELLLYALSMAMTHINNYLASVYPTYEYTDISRMIDLVYSYQESLLDLNVMEFNRMLLSLYKYIEDINTENLMYEKWYVYSLITMFDRNAELLTENFLFVPFLL